MAQNVRTDPATVWSPARAGSPATRSAVARPSSRAGPASPAIQVLERAYALLDVLAAHPDPVPLKDLAAATGLHPSTAHRILNDLTIGRLVDRPEPGCYRLGMRLLELGNLVKARLDVRELLKPPPLTEVPPTLIDCRPAGVLIVNSPAVAPAVSGSVVSPADAPLLSGIVTVGVPSVWPLMVMTLAS